MQLLFISLTIKYNFKSNFKSNSKSFTDAKVISSAEKVKYGDDFNVTCDYDTLDETMYGKTTIQLYNDNQIFTVTDETIYVGNADRGNMGVYTCTVTYGSLGSVEPSMEQIVYQLSDGPTDPNPVFAGIKGGEAVMDCVIYGEPFISITWKKGTKEITDGGNYNISTGSFDEYYTRIDSLTIKDTNVDTVYGDKYSCTVEFSDTITMTYEATLHILGRYINN